MRDSNCTEKPLRMNWVLKALAPTLAILIGWCWLESGWLAILGYHGQIVLWKVVSKEEYTLGKVRKSLGLTLVFVGAGVATYFLLPYLTRVPVSEWLEQYGLGGSSLYIMVFYFGLIHPFLEQLHWRPLCERSAWAHVFFAGYHVLVLVSLFPWYLAMVGFIALLLTSVFWTWLYRREQSGLAAVLSHIFADFGMIIAVALLHQ